MKTILIADDEEHLRLLVATTLAGPEYRILEARDGAEAFDLAQREHPDLMILDWMMPQRTGIEVLEALREDPATTTIPVILLTAKSQKADRNQAIVLGIRGYLVKPFSPLQLIELVEKVLGTEAPV
jgi:CheY-like chemotaxis protein